MSWALVYPRLPGCSTVLGRVAQTVWSIPGCSGVRRCSLLIGGRPLRCVHAPRVRGWTRQLMYWPPASGDFPICSAVLRCGSGVSRPWLGSPVGDSPVGLLVSIPLLGSLFLFSELRPVEAPCSWSDVNRSALLRPAGAGCFAPRRRSSVACSPSGDGGFWRRGGVAAGPERAWDRLVGSRSRGCRVDGRRWLSVSWLVSIAGCPAGPAVPWAVAGFSPGS